MLEAIEFLLLLILLLNDLRLFGFFTPRLEDSFLNLALFVSTLLVEAVVVVRIHPLMLVLHLVVIDFLSETDKQELLLNGSLDRVTYLLDAVFIALFEGQDLVGTLLCVINFFPSLLFLLLEQGDTIGQKLGIPLDTVRANKR